MRRTQPLIASALIAAALLAPVFIPTDYTLQVAFRVFLFAAIGLAWNWVGGYSGQLSLGHAAYFGLGAYGLSLFTKAGVPMWWSLLLAVVLAIIFAAVIGLVSFRLRGPYFALCTIAFAEVVRLVAKNLPNLTGGDVGTQVPVLFPHATMHSFYYAAVVLTAAAAAVTYWIERAKFGYYLMAIREDEDTALSVGVNTANIKLYALLLSAAITAMAGALYGSLFLFIVPDQVLSIEISVEIAIVSMLGGAGTLLGPILGSIVLESASEIFKAYFQEAHLLIYGVLIVIVVLFLPEGIVGTVSQKLRIFKKAPAAPFAEKSRVSVEEETTRTAALE